MLCMRADGLVVNFSIMAGYGIDSEHARAVAMSSTSISNMEYPPKNVVSTSIFYSMFEIFRFGRKSAN